MSSRVLVIDDSQLLVDLTTRALNAAGFDASGATNLAELDRQLAAAFEVILVDVNMPEMFGDDVVDFLRSQRRISSKLILYSDLPEPELSVKAAACGADGYICKSIGIHAAIEAIRGALAKAPVPPLESQRAAEGSRAPRKRRILVVDDSEITTVLLQRELSAKGFLVDTADTAEKATRIILKKKTRPDLVLLDVRMPNVDGEQFCRFIKSNSLFAGIKVLLCSEEKVEELQRICREAGADGYLPKNAVLGQLLSRELA